MAGLVPARISGDMVVPGGTPTWLTPISATLLHGSFAHLAFNMAMFYYLGRFVEPVLGGPRFLLLYVIGAYAAAIAERSEEHTSELQSLMHISYADFCSNKTKQQSIK